MLILLILFSISVSAVVDHIHVMPLDSGEAVPNTEFSYNFTYTNSSDCSNIILEKHINITTNNQGVGFAELDVSGLVGQSVPLYVCEEKNGVLRVVINTTMGLFREVLVNGSVRADKFFQAGNLVLDSSDEANLNVNSSIWWSGETDQGDLNVNSTTWWDGETSQVDLNVNDSDHWDGLDTQEQLNDTHYHHAFNITDEYWINDTQEPDLNVNSSVFWNGSDSPLNFTIVGLFGITEYLGNLINVTTAFFQFLNVFSVNATEVRAVNITADNVTGDFIKANLDLHAEENITIGNKSLPRIFRSFDDGTFWRTEGTKNLSFNISLVPRFNNTGSVGSLDGLWEKGYYNLLFVHNISGLSPEIIVDSNFNMSNKSIVNLFEINFSNGDRIISNGSLAIIVNETGRLIITDNFSTFTGEVRNIDDVNRPSRFFEKNLNNGSNAAAAFTAENDIGAQMWMGITSSGYDTGNPFVNPNQGGLYLNSTTNMGFTIGNNFGFSWRNDPFNSSLHVNTTNILMELKNDGSLNVSGDGIFNGTLNVSEDGIFNGDLDVAGNITGNNIYGNMYVLGNTTFSANSIENVTGGNSAGNISNITQIGSGNYNLTEVTGVPGFDIIINFTGIPSPPRRIELISRYTGSGSHDVEIRILNMTSNQFVDINSVTGDISPSDQMESESFMIDGNTSEFINNTNVSIQIIHTTSGNPNHEFAIDFISITEEQFRIPDAGDYVEISNLTEGSSNGIKLNGTSGDMFIQIAGTYRIEMTTSFIGEESSVVICRVSNNGGQLARIGFTRFLSAGGDVGDATANGVIEANVNDNIHFQCTSDIPDAFVSFNNLDFYIERIGD